MLLIGVWARQSGVPERARSHLWSLRQGGEQRTGSGVGHVIVTASCMIDAVLTAAGCIARQPEQLRNQALASEQPHLAAVQQRQQTKISCASSCAAKAQTGG
jgi:hypothetical protein